MTNLNEKKAADDFLPMSKKAMKRRGWSRCDFVFVIGDAYVDHSSFGPAIISRLWRQMVIKLELFRSRIGKTMQVSQNWVSHALLF